MDKIELLTPKEFGEEMKMTMSGVRRWILEGKIATVKIGRLVRIPASELARLVDAGLRPATRGINRGK